MYAEYEKPLISATIFYYDNFYHRETAEKVLQILEKNHLFQPARISADKLTRGRFLKYKPSMRDTFINAYAEKDVWSVFWETADSRRAEDYLSFQWTFTFYKRSHQRSRVSGKPLSQPWNTLTLQSTYGWLRGKENYTNYMSTIKLLIPVLGAFCAKIDDVNQSVSLLAKANEPHFAPDYIQQVYWGNYWGEHLKNQIDVSYLRNLPLSQFQETEAGVFFTLSESVFDYDSQDCRRLRKDILSKAISP